MVKLYKDLGKTAKKLLGDDYDTNEKSVELKTKTSNGVTYTSKGVLSGEKNAMAGNLSIKYLLSGASMTTKLTTAGAITQEAVVEKTGVKGTKLTVLGGLGSKQFLEVTGEYVHPHLASVIKANCIGQASVSPSVTVGMHGLTVGAQAKYDVEKKSFSGINGVINYSHGKEHEATLQLLDEASKALFSYSHVMKPDFSVAAEFSYDVASEEKRLTMGMKYDVDAETCIKSKMDSSGTMCVSYAQHIRKNTTLTLSTKADMCNLGASPQQFGLALAIE